MSQPVAELSHRERAKSPLLRQPLGHREDEISPPSISTSGRGRCRARGRVAQRMREDLSFTTGAHHRSLSCRPSNRQHRAPHGETVSRGLGTNSLLRTGQAHGKLGTETDCARHRQATRFCLPACRAQLTRRFTSSISISSKTSLRSRALPVALMLWWLITSRQRRVPAIYRLTQQIQARSTWHRPVTDSVSRCLRRSIA